MQVYSNTNPRFKCRQHYLLINSEHKSMAGFVATCFSWRYPKVKNNSYVDFQTKKSPMLEIWRSKRLSIRLWIIRLQLRRCKPLRTLCKGKQNAHAQQTVNCHSRHIIAASLWVDTQSKLLCQKVKASLSFHVTLTSASGVSEYHTAPLIASILLYLKIVQ